ncbi:hypothetical protein [Nostoc sp. CCY 9925]
MLTDLVILKSLAWLDVVKQNSGVVNVFPKSIGQYRRDDCLSGFGD